MSVRFSRGDDGVNPGVGDRLDVLERDDANRFPNKDTQSPKSRCRTERVKTEPKAKSQGRWEGERGTHSLRLSLTDKVGGGK
jgi:hypothetical protein